MSAKCFDPYPEKLTPASSRRYGLMRAGMAARDAADPVDVRKGLEMFPAGSVLEAFLDGFVSSLDFPPERISGTLDDDSRALDQLVRLSSGGRTIAFGFPLRDFTEACGPGMRSLMLRALRPIHVCGRVTITNFDFPDFFHLGATRSAGEITIETRPWVCSEPRTYAKQKTPVLDASQGCAN